MESHHDLVGRLNRADSLADENARLKERIALLEAENAALRNAQTGVREKGGLLLNGQEILDHRSRFER